jgi:hypothetical protein
MTIKLNKVTFGATIPTSERFEVARFDLEFNIDNETDLSGAEKFSKEYFGKKAVELGNIQSVFFNKKEEEEKKS